MCVCTGGAGFNVFVEAKVYSIINAAVIPQPAGRGVLSSSPQGLAPTGV